ncbi:MULTISPECIES: MFS transporter [unclassified Azospirillum]|uniref:MFS transporter n=1 Tax=unclassified Azospirillum TaxID=2630922 RepID=UPI000B68AF7D|nr:MULTISPECIES: MFS transporter [unclassified Azospirillum]SNS19466.1 MFS transporter, AAHS family, 3-hydroxyphenylpropionic acid transporter [Azospirillum sp. RU38E]SNS37130.1 MFS transporter, AAHS family, 3-hydroxyphenylpropionic acid transporter [Azospirillum sp. RU37A]
MHVKDTAPRFSAVTVFLCFLIALLEGFDIQAIGVAAPYLIPDLGLTPGQAGLVFGAGMVGLVAGALTGGWLADRMGRKPLLLACVAIFGLFTLATLVANGPVALSLYRLFAGAGMGAAMPSLIAVAIEMAPPERRTRTITMMFSGMPVGGALAALFAASLLKQYGWHSIFLAGGIAPLLLIPAMIWLMPASNPAPKAAQSAAGPVDLFREGRGLITALAWFTFGMTLLVLYLLLNWLPSLVSAKGLGAGAGAQAAFAFNVGSVAGSLIIGALVDRYGARIPIILAYPCVALSLFGLAQANDIVPVLAYAGLAGFFLLGAQYSLYGIIPLYYPAAIRGLATGAAIAVGRLGSIAGPLVAGHLLGQGWGPAGVALCMVPVVLSAGGAAAIMTLRGRMATA